MVNAKYSLYELLRYTSKEIIAIRVIEVYVKQCLPELRVTHIVGELLGLKCEFVAFVVE